MNKILTTISILIYTVYSQSCTNSHSVSTMVSYSVHGPSVSSIGSTTYLDIVKAASVAFTQGSNQRVGTTAFGGIPNTGGIADAGTFKWELSNGAVADGDGSDIAADIDGFTPDLVNNYGNLASGAILTARNALSGETGRQKYHVIFSATIPLASGVGQATRPGANLDNICSQSITAKQEGIQQYVVLIGTEGVNAFPSFWACAVEDPDTDIIVIDPDNPSYTALTARVCKPNGYDIKITEVKPTSTGTDWNGNGYSAFIEVLNRGATVSIQARFGTGAWSSAISTGTGDYFVAGSVTNGDTGLPTVSPTASAWTASARVGGSSCTSQANNPGCYDEVDYDSSNDGVVSISGRTFELRGIGYNNDYPANWRNSCFMTQSTSGTPGTGPLAECVAITSATTTTATTVSGGSCGQVGLTTCSANGATLTTTCSSDGSYCNCPTGTYVGDVDTCAPLVLPVTTNGCTANIVNWWDGNTYILYQWPRVLYDGTVTYVVTDAAGSSSTSIGSSGYGNAYNPDNPSISVFTIDLDVSYRSPIQGTGYSGGVTDIACGTPVTLDPTPSPSQNPSQGPTDIPSQPPTMNPTFDAPGVYMDAVRPRGGSCNQEQRSCCSPFGPQWGTDNTGGALPSNADETCSLYDNNKVIELQSDIGDSTTEDFQFNLYPDDYTGETDIVVKIYSYGLINNTEFDDLSFAGDYVTSGEIPGIITSANKLEWGPTDRRRRLQNGTNTNSYKFGNKLNIGVSPPANSEGNIIVNPWEGIVTVPQGSDRAILTLNISLADLDCNEGDFDCTTLDDCTSQSLAFAIVALSCESYDLTVQGECKPLYPSTIFFAIRRAEALCFINFNVGNNEDELPDWFWWVLIALIIFLLILAWLVYRFWWKQKKTAAELGDAEDELDQQIADNEAGFGKELDVGDVAFNPMATGVPGMNRPADAFGNELHQRQLQQQNDMVDVQAEIFQVRQDYGQVNTGNRHHQNNMGGY